MQRIVWLLGIVVLSGCSSITVLETDRRDAGIISEINERAKVEEAKVQLSGSTTDFDAQRRLNIARDSVTYRLRDSDFVANTPLADISQISFGDDGSSGLALGIVAGGLAGGAALGLALMLGNDMDCASDDDWLCFSDSTAFAGGFLVGAPLGALIGGIIGASTGSKGVIYRFRPDTPQQMSVVIGVGPRITQNGGAR